MFNFLKKNNNNRQANYGYPYPNYYQPQMPYQQGQPQLTNYDMNIMDTEIGELKRQINDLYKRVTRIENYLGIRQNHDAIQ